MMAEPTYRPSSIPEGLSGNWAVELVHQPIRPGDREGSTDPRRECFHYRPGTYRRLRHGSTTFMTDLYDEWFTQRDAIREACRRGGRVLVTGLGLGLVIDSMLAARGSRVEAVTVVELSHDVTDLVATHLRRRWGDRIEVINADAFAWEPTPKTRYTVAWHDIWPDPWGTDVEAQVAQLEARFAGVCDWQGSWPRFYRLAADGEEPRYHHCSGRATPVR